MEKKTINETQIEELFKFVEQKGVKYYDLQLELVDHLASKIEAEWAENPTFPFNLALTIVYESFGALGFKNLVLKKRKAVEKEYSRILWKNLTAYISSTKVLFTIALYALFYQLLQRGEAEVTLRINAIIGLGLTAISLVWYFVQLQSVKKKFMVFASLRFAHFWVLSWAYLGNIHELIHFFNDYYWVGALLLTTIWVFALAAEMTAYQQLSKERKLYPEAFS